MVIVSSGFDSCISRNGTNRTHLSHHGFRWIYVPTREENRKQAMVDPDRIRDSAMPGPVVNSMKPIDHTWREDRPARNGSQRIKVDGHAVEIGWAQRGDVGEGREDADVACGEDA